MISSELDNFTQLESRQTGMPQPRPPLPRQLHPNLHSSAQDHSAQRLHALAERLPPVPAGHRGTGNGSLVDQLRKSNWFSEAHLSRNSYTLAPQEADANFRRKESRRWPVARIMAPACRTPARKSKKHILCAPILCFAHQSATLVLC